MSRAEKLQRLEATLVRVLARKDITRIRPQGAPTSSAARPAASKPSALEALMGPAMDLGGDDLSEVPTSIIQGRASASDVLAAPEPSFRIEGRARAPEPPTPRAPEPVVAKVAPPTPAPEPVVAKVAPPTPAPEPVVARLAPLTPAPEPVVAELRSNDKPTPMPGSSDLELGDGPEIELSFDEPAPVASPTTVSVIEAPEARVEVTETPIAVVVPEAAPEPVAELIEVGPGPEPEPEPEPVAELIEVTPEAPAVVAATTAVAVAAIPSIDDEPPVERISSVEIEPEELELQLSDGPQAPRTPPPLPPSRPPPDALTEVEVARDVTPEVRRIRESIPAPVEPESLKPPRDPSTAPAAVETARAESFSPAALPPLPGFVSVVPAVTAERPKTLRGMLDRALSLRPRR